MKKKVTAVFDIGKTNKKFFLFDSDYQEVFREYARFEPIEDEDGYPAEDLMELQNWLKSLVDRILNAKDFRITAINFSTYGASMVHLGENGEVLTPLYNYTKPLAETVMDDFIQKYGPEMELAIATGSSCSGMLNSGMQLYRLKYARPDIFRKIKYSLHLPQYISYLFTGMPVSEYTSIGCHTFLWDFRKHDYHGWVYEEGFHRIFPPIVSTATRIHRNYHGKRIRIGVGIHDSSAALLPYLHTLKKKFILLSTGTWSIALNPFSDTLPTEEDFRNNCIHYMGINGKPVRSASLFLGNEYNLQVKRLARLFNVPPGYHKKVLFNQKTFQEVKEDFEPIFHWESFTTGNMPEHTRIPYARFEQAYHHLMTELVLLQVECIKTAAGGDPIKRLYIDGGFSNNEVYIKSLAHYLGHMKIRTADASLGSALGAAIAISDTAPDAEFLKRNYALKMQIPVILK